MNKKVRFKEEKADMGNENLPLISFVIPTLNSARTIEKCLVSIRKQNYPFVEIILIDGFSTDRTIEIAIKYVDHVYYSSCSLGESRQIGVEKSRGQILGIFDSDIILPHSSWLLRAVKQFSLDNNIAAVWPLQIPPKNASALSWCYLAHQWSIIRYRVKKGLGVMGGGNALFKRKCIQDVGGFRTDLNCYEDFDLAKKLKKRGYKTLLYGDPIIHDTHVSFSEFIRKSYQRIRASNDGKMEKLMELPQKELFYEYCVLPLCMTLKGIFINKEPKWLLLPLLTLIRSLLYLYIKSFMHIVSLLQPRVS
jgi:glycosyltransferase involved in cell wall biosynthesis